LYYKGKKSRRHTDEHVSTNSDFHGYGNKIRAELVARIPKNRKLKVLDVGTGFGLTTGFLAKILTKGSEIWTVDPSKEILDNVRTKLAEEGLDSRIPIEYVRAEAAKLDFEDDFFDTIISVMVLHHLEDLTEVMNELLRVMKKGGRLLLVDYMPRAGMELEFQKRHKESDFFKPEEVVRIMEKGGASKIKLKRVKLWYLADATK
jgi:ubiquinone/menaquinone biosynthesis C-methylase UbiE